MQKEGSEYQEIKLLKEQLLSLKQRLLQVEKSLDVLKNHTISSSKNATQLPEQDLELNFPFKPIGSIEFGIGEYGMAWLGNIVLLIAIVFFVQNIHNNGSPGMSILIGYASVTGI